MKDSEKIIMDKRAELRKLRFGTSGAGAKNVKMSRNIRKEIARAFTKLRAERK